jgi:pilus assembly protein CpaF
MSQPFRNSQSPIRNHQSSSWWIATQKPIAPEHLAEAVELASSKLAGLPLSQARDRRKVGRLARQELTAALRDLGYGHVPDDLIEQHLSQVVSRVGGLRFLDALIPPHCDLYTDIQLNANGSVWVRPKGRLEHVLLPDVRPGQEEVWQVIERLLAPEGKACSEATPTVDAKIPRDPDLGFGGARLKVLHPSLVVGEYPVLSLRLYEPVPVPPEQILAWGVCSPNPFCKPCWTPSPNACGC